MTPTDHSHNKSAGQAGHDHLYDENTLHNEDVAHEHSDINVRAVLMFGLGMIIVTAIIQVAMAGLFNIFEGQAAARDQVSPLAPPAGQLPPEPRLLTDERQNLQRFHTQQIEGLKGIDDAKKRLLEQGLPVRADAPTDPWVGTRSPARGESSGGRNIPTQPRTAGGR